MALDATYAVSIAPQADAEIKKASEWWRENRPKAPGLLRDEVGRALLLIADHPESGRRVWNRKFGSARFVVLRRSRYVLYYQVLTATREVYVVHFRHGRRLPLKRR